MVKPRVECVPTGDNRLAKMAVKACRRAGLRLDDWQSYAFERALLTRPDGKWAAMEVGVDVARQNGKGGILEARALAGIFVFEERLIIHSAHLVDTSLEAMERLLYLIEDIPEFDGQVKRVVRTNGREGIIFRSGQRIRFRTRTKGGGRGFTADCLLLDEAMFLPEMTMGALIPTLSARPNPQVWYTGSAVDQMVHDHGSVFARVRRRGIAQDKGVAYFEWSAPYEIDTVGEHLDDRDAWVAANPAIGIRINEEFIKTERRAMDNRTFAVERLGVGDWPSDADGVETIEWDRWRELVDNQSFMLDPICLAFDVPPARDRVSIVAAGLRGDGLLHFETVEYRRGTGWFAEKIQDLVGRMNVHSVSYDPGSPASSLVRQLENLGVRLEKVGARDYAAACGYFHDGVTEGAFRHLGTDELATAVKNAATRPLGDSWAWSRKNSAADISPLVAATLAVWQASANLSSVYDDRGVIAL
jgi:phage terminase large subunit-like protein